jgi:uncharacterized membrane protein
VLILVAVCAGVLVASVALTVDLGRISTTRRDLQTHADAVALDVSRRLDGTVRSQVQAAATASFTRSLGRNGVPAASARLDLGSWDPVTERWRSAAADEVPTAARVEISQRVDHAFAPGSTTTSRIGIASQRASADLCVGSFAARVRTDDSPVLRGLLAGVLGTSLDVVGYRGIAGGTVSVEALATRLGTSLGTPTAFLDTRVTLRDLVAAEAQVLADAGDLARADLLRSLLVGLPNPTTIVRLGDVVDIGRGGTDAALGAALDAFDLLTTAALVANGSNFVSIPNLDLGVPGIAAVTARASVVERPTCLIAGAVGDRLQTAVVRVELAQALGVIGVVDISLVASVRVADGTARIGAIGCGAQQRLRLDVTTGLAESDIRFTLGVNLLGRVEGPVTASTSNAATTRTFDRLFPPSVFGTTYQVPTPGLDLGTATLHVGGVLSPVGAVVNPVVTGVLTPVLAGLDRVVLTPLLGALGVTVGGLDVVPRAIRCQAPSLVG